MRDNSGKDGGIADGLWLLRLGREECNARRPSAELRREAGFTLAMLVEATMLSYEPDEEERTLALLPRTLHCLFAMAVRCSMAEDACWTESRCRIYE